MPFIMMGAALLLHAAHVFGGGLWFTHIAGAAGTDNSESIALVTACVEI